MNLRNAANKLAKWRTVFAGWQLGTRPKGDPECDAVRDHREATILLRAEVSALTRLWIEAHEDGKERFERTLLEECTALDADYERRFPGFRTSLEGIHMDERAAETMKGWLP